MNKDLEFLTRVIDEKSAKILDANDKIWEYAELAFHETKSAALLKSILKEEGFALTEGDAGIPTCFTGTFSYGTGKPVMGILGEYDALSSLTFKGRRSGTWLRPLRARYRRSRRCPGCQGIPDRQQEGRNHHLLRLPG